MDKASLVYFSARLADPGVWGGPPRRRPCRWWGHEKTFFRAADDGVSCASGEGARSKDLSGLRAWVAVFLAAPERPEFPTYSIQFLLFSQIINIYGIYVFLCNFKHV